MIITRAEGTRGRVGPAALVPPSSCVIRKLQRACSLQFSKLIQSSCWFMTNSATKSSFFPLSLHLLATKLKNSKWPSRIYAKSPWPRLPFTMTFSWYGKGSKINAFFPALCRSNHSRSFPFLGCSPRRYMTPDTWRWCCFYWDGEWNISNIRIGEKIGTFSRHAISEI